MSTSLAGGAPDFLHAGEAERRKNLSLALVASAGLHLILLLTLGAAPGEWRQGLQPALQVALREIVPPAEATPPATQVQAAGEPENALDAPPAANRPARAAVRSSGFTDSRVQPGASMPSMDRYFLPSELDVLPRAVERGPLVYPENAYVWRLSGTVRARVFISERGTVDSVQILEARPHPGIFEEAAVDALRQVRYEPAEIRGLPVKSQRVVEVVFNPHEDVAHR